MEAAGAANLAKRRQQRRMAQEVIDWARQLIRQDNEAAEDEDDILNELDAAAAAAAEGYGTAMDLAGDDAEVGAIRNDAQSTLAASVDGEGW